MDKEQKDNYWVVRRSDAVVVEDHLFSRDDARAAKRNWEALVPGNHPPHYLIELGPDHKHYNNPAHEQIIR
jgi:hypothetical protein